MNNPHQVDRPDLIAILDNFGKQICSSKSEFITYTVTSTSSDGILIDFTLYILAPEISYEYRAINVELIDVANLKIRFFTLATKQSEHYDIDISNGTTLFQSKLFEIQNFGLFKAAIEFLINQTLLRRENRTGPIRNKIIDGQARVAVLNNNDKINVGWIRVEGDEVIYYTGQGLREMWKPNMTAEEQKTAQELRLKSETELMNLGYIDKKKIEEFKDIL